jgi:hypothetical protein
VFGSFQHLLYGIVGHGGHAFTNGVCLHLAEELKRSPAYSGINLEEGVVVIWSGAR